MIISYRNPNALFLFLSLLFLSTLSYGQTVLSAGDIAMTGANSDNNDEFAFVTFVDLEIGTEIRFSDSGWTAGGTFRCCEGGLKFTADQALSAGSVVVVDVTAVTVSVGLIAIDNDATIGTNNVNLSSSGDQVHAFQGLSTSPTFIASINFDGSTWAADATSSNNTAIPTGLTDQADAVSVAEADNMVYNGTTVGTVADLLLSINNPGNWTTNNTTRQNLAIGPFTIQSSCTAPTTQATIGTPSVDGDNQITVNWTRGDGTGGVLVLAKEGSSVDSDPVSGDTYTANSAFASGDQIGTGNYVVYDGTGTSVSVTALNPGTEYHFGVYEYNTLDVCYAFPGTTTLATTTTSLDTDSDITDPTAQVAAGNISSVSNAEGDATDVFSFKLTDSNSGDGSATMVNTIVIVQGMSNTIADWSAVIGGAKLNDGADVTVTGTTINADNITFDLTGNEYNVADNSSADLTLSIWLNTTVTDGDAFQFNIPVNHGFVADANGSTFVTTLSAAVTSNLTTIDVAATTYAISSQVYGAEVSTNFGLTVQAHDANGNLDIDYSEAVTLSKNSGDGNLASGSNLMQSLVSGEFAWSDLTIDAAGNHLIDAGGGLGTVTSENLAIYVAGQVIFNEIHADPSNSGTDGDANGDGVGNFNDDEFFEILNIGAADLDLANWVYSDGTSSRHVFPSPSLLSANTGNAIVVFGGGTPTGTFGGATVQTASTGSVGLNNGGESISINDGGSDAVALTYPSAGNNQSITLNPDITGGSFEEHSGIVESGGALYSPGTKIDGSIFCSVPSLQASSVMFGTTDETSMVINWTQGDGESALVVVKQSVAVDVDPSLDSDYTSATPVFSDAVVDLGGGNIVVFAGNSSDQTVTVTGLSQGTTYHVAIYEYNNASFCYNTDTPATGNNTTATTADTDSNITAAGGTTSNIDYAGFQEASNLSTSNSVSLFSFDINDMGTVDALSTTLTDISFDITNSENIRTLAIFEGSAMSSTTEIDVAGNISGSTLAISGLNLVAAPGTSLSVTVRATFSDAVDDEEQIQLVISSATADSNGSVFDAPDAGGASSDVSTADLNAIEVTATTFEFSGASNAAINSDFDATVTAVDALGNTDLADRNVTLSLGSGSGNLSSTTGLGPNAMTDGVFTWSDLVHDLEEIITLSATDGMINGTSGDIDIFTVITGVFFSEYVEGSSNNKVLEVFNNSGAAIDLSEFGIELYFNGGTSSGRELTLSDFAPTLADGATMVITNPSASAAIMAVSDIASEVTFFNGDDAIALFHYDVIIDVIGEIGNDPGSGWSVAGTATGTQNHTLIRKSSVMEGNPTNLASFGTMVSDSEWTVLGIDEISDLGLHTIDGTDPAALTATHDLADFGTVDNGMSSDSQTITVAGSNLLDDVNVLAPINFEVSIDDSAFANSVTLNETAGEVAETTIYVRFSPASGFDGVKAGDITISSSGAPSLTIGVTGTESGNSSPTSGVIITELADPNNNSGLRFIELYNTSTETVDFTEGSGWRIDKYTNASSSVSQTLALTGSIAPGGYYIIASGSVDTDFETAYGIAPDQFDGSNDNVAGSNGDDNLELYNGSNELIDQFGVPGVDGTGTDHEFEDGRAERKETVMVGNPLWDVNEWNIDNDSGGGAGTQDAPDDFDPGFWIGSNDPVITADVSSFQSDFGGIPSGSTSMSSTFIVSGTNLTDDITITAPTGFSISDDGSMYGTSVNLTQSGGDVAPTSIYVIFEPSAEGVVTGDITLSSTGAIDQNVAVSGTGLSASTIFFEGFAECPSTSMVTFSVASNEDWECTSNGNSGEAAFIGGFGADVASEDWLITPQIDLSGATNATLTFYSWTNFSDAVYPPISVLASTDYSGSGDPTSANWMDLTALFAAEDSETWTASGDIDLQTYVGGSVFIAFEYTSTGTTGGTVADWAIDDILVEDRAAVSNPTLTVTATLSDFGSIQSGSVSTSQSFTVEGADLSEDISITAPGSYELSLDDSSFGSELSLTPVNRVVSETTIYVRFAPSSGINGAINGDITISTAGASDETVSVEGTETGNVALADDLFFSEYFEGSSNNKYVEIYNATGAPVDLSNYTVKQSNNGAGFDGHATVPDAYNVTLSGTLAAADVYIIYNGSASLSEILAEGDLALSFGDNPGDRVAAFNGDDAMGLFKNDVLIDLIGDPLNDPGTGWDVAGTTTGTANHTLVRKSSITQGNIDVLGSFGVDVASSEWTVLDQDDVTNIGFHTVDGVATAALTVTANLTDFGSVDNGSSSTSQSIMVSGENLIDDINITAPSNFEVSIDDSVFGNSVTLSQTGGTVTSTTVYVRFSPSTGFNGAKTGDVAISSSGAATISLEVNGTESGNAVATSGVFITELADPNNNSGLRFIELYNSSDDAVDFTEGSGWRIDKYTNASATVSQTLALSGSIEAGGYYIIATGAVDTDFETAYGIAPDQFDGADNDVAGSNGDDNLELYNGSGILIDQFGVPGEDGTGTDHEFEDGRAERIATVTVGNPAWDVNEWIIDNDDGGGDGAQDAPEDFDPGAWIGSGDPVITVDISSFQSDFGGVNVGSTSMSSTFSVSGSNLTGDITIGVADPFTLSTDGTVYMNTITLTQSGGEVTATTIYTRFEPTEVGAVAETINFTTDGANDQILAVSGTGLDASSIFFEGFADCPSAVMTTFSVASDEDWDCTSNGNSGNAAFVGGFGADAASDDWLITPEIDLSGATNATLTFFTWTNFTDITHPTLSVQASTDYTGSGDPNAANWVDLTALFADQDSETWTASGDIDLQTYVGGSVYIGFQYTSSGTTGGTVADWAVDDISIEDRSSVASPSLTVTASLSDFGSVQSGSVSTSQSFTVEGSDLTDDVSVEASEFFEISLDDNTFSSEITLTPTAGAVASTTIHVRFSASSGINGNVTGEISISTTGAAEETLSLSGTETGNQSIADDLFFSEYFEGSSNNKYIEIYNATGAPVDLSSYTVKQANNGVGFDGHPTDPDAYNITLSGTLAAADVYIIYNGSASLTEILAEGDIALSFGDNPGDRVAAFNGDDAMGLFKNGALIDLIGDPLNDPGSGWDVAGTTTGTANHTLVRKSSITQGNIDVLGSFGTDEASSEWIVLDQDDVSNIGFHTVDGVATAALTVTADLNDFGSVDNGSSSASQSIMVSGENLINDIKITAPTNFEVSDDDSVFGNSVTLSQTGGTVSATTIYVRFSPATGFNGAKTGDLTISSGGAASISLELSGTESGNAEVTSGVFMTELADPNNNAGLRYIELYNSSDETVDFTEGSGWRIDKYTNASATVSQTLALTGSIEAGGYYIIATGAEDTDFETAYGIAPDQFDGADNDVAGSNGDDNLELYNGSNILIDQFGVPGEDGTDTDHEFEDGRAERIATVTVGNPVWDVNEWNIDNDGGGGDGTQDAPEDFDPGAWIGSGGPVITVNVNDFQSDFGGVNVGTTSMSSTFSVSGLNLTGDITIGVANPFTISLDGTAYMNTITLAQSGGEVAATTVYAIFEPTEVGAANEAITFITEGANNQIVAVSGTGLDASSIFFEGFADCPSTVMSTFSVASDANWDCTSNGNSGDAAFIGGFAADAASDDWLISPEIDLSNATNATLTFFTWTNFSDVTHPTLSVQASTDYTGSGDPNAANWVDLPALYAAQDTEEWTPSGDVNLQTYVGGTVYIAFQYTSSGTTGGTVADWAVDDILIEDRVAVDNPSVTITASLTDFGTVDNGSVSASQSFSIEGADLLGTISLEVSSNFEISLDDTNFDATLELTPMTGSVASTQIFVRFAPSSGINGTINGSITVTTASANDQTIALSGTEAGNAVIEDDLFFSEYIEPDGGNEKAIEIYNGTGAAVDLSEYMVRVSRNGAGFGNDGVPYDLALSGTLADDDVYIIYNGDATNATILAEGDIAVTFGDNAGDRVASFNGNDAIGLFKNGVLVDLIGDPLNDPGNGWAVAGVATATQNHTLIRKESIRTGNVVPLGSFGTNETDSEWIVLDANTFDNLGSHTVADPVDPGFALTTTDFNGDFGTVQTGETSQSSSYIINAAELTTDLVVTIPAGFEAALDDQFQGLTGDSSVPLTIPIENGGLDNVTVYVRFAPETAGSFSGNLVHSTTGYEDQSVAVSGEGTEIAGVEGLKQFGISMYPNPAEHILNLSIPREFGISDVSIISLEGAILSQQRIDLDGTINVNHLSRGLYIIRISNNHTTVTSKLMLH